MTVGHDMFVTVFVTVTVNNDSVAESDQDQGMVQRVAKIMALGHDCKRHSGTLSAASN